MNRFSRYGSIALAATISLPLISLRVEANPALIPAAAACMASLGCALAVVVIAGVSYYAITYDGEQTFYVPIGGGYLEDPEEGSDEWYDYVWADDEAQAIRRCQSYAEANGVRYVRVRKAGGKRYECWVSG